MPTPEGYWSWHELLEASSDWTEQIVSRSILSEEHIKSLIKRPYELRNSIYKTLVNIGKVDNLSEARFAMDLLELWVLANFMDLYDAVICSPDGRILRCPPILKAHGDAFDWWSWPLSNERLSQGEAYGYFEAFRSSRFGIGDARARFAALDYETGDIRLKANSVRLLYSTSYGHGVTEEEILRFIDQQIRPLIGWSICWNDAVFPETEYDLFASLGFGDLDWTDVGQATPRSSTKASYQNIIGCVIEAYPDGKGAEIWDDVVKRVGYSRRSIRRALTAEGRYETWIKGGHK